MDHPDAGGSAENTVLILGAGINGAALARELTLGGMPVVVVDTADVASGATAFSSRLIHGGLRYLEYGELDLVRESLAERTRWLRLAPHLVHPLKLCIPVASRVGGLASSLARFLHLRHSGTRPEPPRGLWLVRAGLWLYDRYAHDPVLPPHQVSSVDQSGIPVDRARYRWMCAYYDAQCLYPERFTLELLEDARRSALSSGVSFELFTYHEARLEGRTVEIRRTGGRPVRRFQPAAIVNATGAWVDYTLERLQVPSPRLMGGTKGSHIVTSQERICQALGGLGLYAEADDGRPVFLMPFGNQSLIGTTDVAFAGDPREAVASPSELDYLLRTANQVLPGVGLTADDIDLHYCGVRPLPYCDGARPAAITRRHWLEEHPQAALPLYSLVGGKLTTCRSLAEQTAATLRRRLGLPPGPSTRDRPLPGAAEYPATPEALAARLRKLASDLELDLEQVRVAWSLLGTRADQALAGCTGEDRTSLPGTMVPAGLARWMIRNEWVQSLGDLVERRLMLLYHRDLSLACLDALAALLAQEEVVSGDAVESEVQQAVERLRSQYGKRPVDADR